MGVEFTERSFCSGVTGGEGLFFEDGVDIINSFEMSELMCLRGEVRLVRVSLRSGVTEGDIFEFDDGLAIMCTDSSILP